MNDDFENDSPENENPDTGEESFASMFEQYMTGVKDDLQVGEEVIGKIISIGDDSVFINTGTKVDGVVDKLELMDDEGELKVKLGDTLKLYVVSMGEGEIRLSRAITGAGGTNRLYDAYRNRIPVEGKVTETCKGGFRVNILGKIAFCPVSQIDVAYVEQPDIYVGGGYEFLITRIEEKGRNIVVSRRELLNRYIAEERKKFLESVNAGDIVEARITKIMPFGAFAEVAPGVEGMIHISELSWTRVSTPEEAVAAGDTVKVRLLSIENVGKGSKPPRISLSIKQALGDPWEKIFDKYQHGDKIQGTVTRCADFGAFVEIEPGVEGLVHISELSHKRVVRPDDVVRPGEKVSVTIKNIDPGNRRMSLSMKDAEGDPWVHIAEKFAVGQTVTGRIENKEKFGYFVALEPGIVGLLPISKIKGAPNAKEIENLRVDAAITVGIEAIDRHDRKITLTIGDPMDKEDWRQFRTDKGSPTGMGNLGEKLKAAMKPKE